MIAKSQKKNFTEGKIFPKLLLFVLPIVATNLLQMFYNAADMIVVSLSSEENAVGAVGVTGSFVSLVVNTFIGFSVGANVTIARHIGANDGEGARKAAHTSIILGFISGLLGAAVGISVSRIVLKAMGAKGNLLDLAVKYTYFYFAGVPFLSMTNYLIAVFRAKGDSKTPLVVLACSGLLNVGMNLLFVLVFGWSVEGVAVATALANFTSFIALLIKLGRDQDSTSFSFKRLRIDKKELKDIVRIGFPSAIQSALFSISNMLVQSSVVSVNNSLVPEGSKYQPVVDGCAAGANVGNFTYMAMEAVRHGTVTFTSQNLGAKKPKRVYSVVGSSCLLVTLIGVLFGYSIFFLHEPLLALYGVKDGAKGTLAHLAMQAATTQIKWTCLPYFFCGIMEVGSGALRGLGFSFLSMVISLVGSCLLRVVWLLTVFPLNPTLNMIYLCYPISWLVTAATLHAFTLLRLKKIVRANGEL